MSTPSSPSSTIVKLSPECQQYYQDVRIKNKYQGVVYKINKETNQMIIDKTFQNGCSFNELIQCFKENECSIIVFKYVVLNSPKLYFIYWGSETAPQSDKVLYSNAKLTLAITLKGIDVKIAGTKNSELTEEIFKERGTPKQA
ncbi:hypothetical protein RB653_010475 [Dictyostelium firmibasis]|uniref:ADF-H domain-containing protein n=1 Tax=Dictyostelium firmibasis TaxID=79012 RepID=A0AAN7TLL8_9MYCE